MAKAKRGKEEHIEIEAGSGSGVLQEVEHSRVHASMLADAHVVAGCVSCRFVRNALAH